MYRFIFADDEDLIRESFQELFDFSELGFELVKTFSNAEAVLNYLQEDPVELVITDIKMGQVSGLDLCEEVRRRYPDITMVLLTGYRDFTYAQRAIRQNVFDYLVKPTSYSDLTNLFHRLREYLDSKVQCLSTSVRQGQEVEPEYRGLISQIKTLAEQNLSHSYSLNQIADTLAMNPAYLSRLFKEQTGQNFNDYMTELRIHRATELMADPTIKIYEIGYMVGYQNTQYFYKVFKASTGLSPKQYQMTHTKNK